MKESQIEKECIFISKSYSNILCSKIKAGAQKHSIGTKSFLKKSSIPGFADLLLCINGKYIAVELKTKTGRQSDVQKIYQQKVEAAGGLYYICRSINEFIKIIETHL